MNSLFKFAFALVLGLHACMTLAADEVKFQKVQSTVTTRYGQHQQIVRFEASVANLAYQKEVYAHLKGSDGVWMDVPLSYVRSTADSREVWGTTWLPPLNTTFDLQFAMKYQVNGNTYWDNNENQNYLIAKDSGSLLARGLNVHNAEYRLTESMGTSQTVYGWVTLRNLAYAKVVRVRYTTDNWASWRDASATYSPYFWSGWYSSASNPNAYGFEEWSFSLDVGSIATAVEYAIQYEVAGQTYWDNNHGANYRTTLSRP